MARVDTAWLRMERPDNRMTIVGVFELERPLALTRLRRVIAERFLSFPRFRQRPVETASGAFWELDEALDLTYHVRADRLPAGDGRRALEILVGRLASEPLDPKRPRWRFHLVHRPGAGSVVIGRVHHCYADGLAMVRVILTMTDAGPTERRRASSLGPRARDAPSDGGSGMAGLLHRAEHWVAQGLALAADPQAATHALVEGGMFARELAHVVALADDPPTSLVGALGVDKRCAWSEPIPLDEVKAVGRAFGCTVNDVLMACVAGALRGVLRDRGEATDGLIVRATVPVSLRALDEAARLGNHFGLVFLELPVGEANPLRRLDRVTSTMRDIKGSRQAFVTFGLLAALGLAPAALQRGALELFSRKATLVATNVPGPATPLYLGGARIVTQMFWVPQSGRLGLGLSILSYAGHVHCGVMADARLLPEPGDLVGRLRPELEKLLLIALLSEWDRPIAPDEAERMLREALATRRDAPNGGAIRRAGARRHRELPSSAARAARRLRDAEPVGERARSQPVATPTSHAAPDGFAAALRRFRGMPR